jgi:hypothetical protein
MNTFAAPFDQIRIAGRDPLPKVARPLILSAALLCRGNQSEDERQA